MATNLPNVFQFGGLETFQQRIPQKPRILKHGDTEGHGE